MAARCSSCGCGGNVLTSYNYHTEPWLSVFKRCNHKNEDTVEGYASGLGAYLTDEEARLGGGGGGGVAGGRRQGRDNRLLVTLLAHSTGGLIASFFKESLARSFDPPTNKRGNLVIFPPPHRVIFLIATPVALIPTLSIPTPPQFYPRSIPFCCCLQVAESPDAPRDRRHSTIEVDRVCTIGTPFLGAWLLAYIYSGGEDFVR
jgi:hypothetical protein